MVYTDAFGRQVATKSYIVSSADESKLAVTLLMYDSKGLLSKVINPKKQVSTYTNNIMGWLVSKKTVDAGSTYLLYNQSGQVILEQDSLGKTSSTKFYRRYTYDDFGRLIRQEKSSRLGGPAAGTAPFEARTGYLDDYSWTFVRNISGTNRDYTYFLTNAKKEKEVFYDTKPTTLSDYPCASSFTTDNALGKVTATISYDNNNTAVLYQLFKYNTDGRMAQEVQQFNKNGMGSVNGSGQVEDLFARIVYTWGVQQELIARSVYLNIVKPPVGGSCVNVEKLKKQYYYTYDNWGRLKELFYNDLEVGSNTGSGARKVASYTYDLATGQMKTRDNYTFLDADYANINTNTPVTYAYDHKNRLTGMTSNLFDWLMYYDANQPSGSGVPGTTSSNYNGNINGTYANYKVDSYGLDSFSNRGQTWYTYTYDGLNRLTDAYGNMQNSSGGLIAVDERATYDSIGNIRTLKRSGNGVFNGVYTYAGTSNRLSSIKDGVTTRNYSYSANGALILDQYRVIGINAADYGRSNLPFKLTKTGGAVYNYLYNNKDVRIARFTTIGTDFYLIDELGTTLAVISAGNLEVKEWYIDGEARTQFDGNSKEYPVFLLKDHLGNIRLGYSSDNAGAKIIQNAYDYYPYGKLMRNYDYWSRQRYLTTGNERDAETGWDYRNARYSDADIGRFLSVDPMMQERPEWTPYNYCRNLPVYNIDPDGMFDYGYIGIYNNETDQYDKIKVSQVGGKDIDYIEYFGGALNNRLYMRDHRGEGKETWMDVSSMEVCFVLPTLFTNRGALVDANWVVELGVGGLEALLKGAAVRTATTTVTREVVESTLARQAQKAAVQTVGTTINQAISNILMPGGKVIGSQIASNTAIRTVTQTEANNIMKQLIKSGAKSVSKQGYPGVWYELPGGGGFGVRSVVSNKSINLGSKGAIDINIPGIAIKNIKF